MNDLGFWLFITFAVMVIYLLSKISDHLARAVKLLEKANDIEIRKRLRELGD